MWLCVERVSWSVTKIHLLSERNALVSEWKWFDQWTKVYSLSGSLSCVLSESFKSFFARDIWLKNLSGGMRYIAEQGTLGHGKPRRHNHPQRQTICKWQKVDTTSELRGCFIYYLGLRCLIYSKLTRNLINDYPKKNTLIVDYHLSISNIERLKRRSLFCGPCMWSNNKLFLYSFIET